MAINIDAVKRNVIRLRDAGASDAELDQYVVEQGLKPEDITGSAPATAAPAPQRSTLKDLAVGFKKQLPTVGGMAGLAIGGGLTAGTAAIPATVLGTMAGKAAENTIDALTGQRKTNVAEDVRDIAKEGLLSGTFEVGGPVVMRGAGNVLKKVAAPFKNQYDPAVEAAAKRLGVDVAPSAMSKSKTVADLETWASRGWFGNKLMDRMTGGFKQLNDGFSRTVSSLKGYTQPEVAGKVYRDAFNRYKEQGENFIESIYGEVESKIPKVPYVERKPIELYLGSGDNWQLKNVTEILNKADTSFMPRSRKVLEDILNRKKSEFATDPESLKYFKDTLDGIMDKGKQTYYSLKNSRTTLGQKLKNWDDVVSRNEADIKKLYGAMSEDRTAFLIKSHPDAAPLLKRADKANVAYMKRLEGEMMEFVQKNKDTPSVVGEYFADPNVPIEMLPNLRRVMGSKNIEQLQKSVMDNLYKRSLNKVGEELTPTGLGGILKNSKERLAKILTPQQMQRLNDLSVTSIGLGRTAKAMGGSHTAPIALKASELAVLMNGVSDFVLRGQPTHLIAGMLPLAGDAGLNRFVNSPFGRKYLTYGVSEGAERIAQSMSKFATVPSKTSYGLLKAFSDEK